MIEYCLDIAECDPDIEIKLTDELKTSDEVEYGDDDDDDGDENEEMDNKGESEEESVGGENEEIDDDNDDDDEKDEISNENLQQMDTASMDNVKSDSKLKETSIFCLLRTVPFVDSTMKHPLEIFLKKAKNLNVLHHKSHRTPLLEAIYLRQPQTAQMLIDEPSCDINLASSNLLNERRKTPLILACKLLLLPIVRSLLEHKMCQISSYDNENNQAIHYYLQTSDRSSEYLDILNIFIKKLKLKTINALNTPGKHQRTPLHIAVYHNLGTINAITNIEKILIENGSDLMTKDSLGNIPLHNVFLNKEIGDDPVELCVLIIRAMKFRSIDTTNNEGNTPLHLAVVSLCAQIENITHLLYVNIYILLDEMFHSMCNAFTATSC